MEKEVAIPEELKAAGLIVPEPKPTLPFVVCAEYIPDRYADVKHVRTCQEYLILQRLCAWI